MILILFRIQRTAVYGRYSSDGQRTNRYTSILLQISQHKGVLIYKGLFARSLVAVPVSYREDVQCIGCMSSFYIAGDVFFSLWLFIFG